MKYIKVPISTEITDKGGARAVFTDKTTVPLETTIQEAIKLHYVIGQDTLLKGNFRGLFLSAAEGVAMDGRPRIVAGLFKIFLVPKGEIDPECGWDPEKNYFCLRVRLLKDIPLDTSGWTFEDVTPGKREFVLMSVLAGTEDGVYELGKPGEVNGRNLPNMMVGETIQVDWAVEGTDKSGTLPADKVTSKATRIDIAEGAFDEIKSSAYDGKTLTLTVRGNFAKASKSATLKFVPAPLPTVTNVKQEDLEPNVVWFTGGTMRITGERLAEVTGVKFQAEIDGATVENDITEDIETKTDTELVSYENGFENHSGKQDSKWSEKPAKLILVKGEDRVEYDVTFGSAE